MWWLLVIPAFFIANGISKSILKRKAPAFIDEKISNFKDSLLVDRTSYLHEFNREQLRKALEAAQAIEDKGREKIVLNLLSKEL